MRTEAIRILDFDVSFLFVLIKKNDVSWSIEIVIINYDLNRLIFPMIFHVNSNIWFIIAEKWTEFALKSC